MRMELQVVCDSVNHIIFIEFGIIIHLVEKTFHDREA